MRCWVRVRKIHQENGLQTAAETVQAHTVDPSDREYHLKPVRACGAGLTVSVAPLLCHAHGHGLVQTCFTELSITQYGPFSSFTSGSAFEVSNKRPAQDSASTEF